MITWFKRRSQSANDQLNRNIMLDMLSREIAIFESQKDHNWSIARDDDLKTLKKAYQILLKSSRS